MAAKTKSRSGQFEARVVEKIYLTPHLIRIILTSEDVPLYADATIGVNNKILIPPAGVDEIHFPTFDFEAGKWLYPAPEVAPVVRTYTHRAIDVEKKQLMIDFVAHGEAGPASRWAIHAKEGDLLGIMMHMDPSVLYAEADWYFLIGDATAIPVISAILEDLPASSHAEVLLEVHGKEDEIEPETNASYHIHWLHNINPENSSELASFAKDIEIPEHVRKFAYVATEYRTVKELRNYFRKELEWTKDELYAYSYWKAGQTEDGSAADRHEESYGKPSG
ncbi:siderophore-interacting protein [Sphingobacterium spiritivorum]|uniref:siderophore-interacting protein n=1 Tax=Sphingobacterium spiritivorum TaxID=258 RepID=UPI003DA68E61